MKNWKTTVQSILTVLIGIVPIVMGWGLFTVKQATIIGSIPAIAKVVIGIIQKDCDQQQK